MGDEQKQDEQPHEKQQPNIRLAGGKDVQPLGGAIHIGMSAPIILPDEKKQRAGWYEPRAVEVVKLHVGTYKLIEPKGAN